MPTCGNLQGIAENRLLPGVIAVTDKRNGRLTMADQATEREARSDCLDFRRFTWCFEYGDGIRQQKGKGVRFSRVMIAWTHDLQVAQLRFDRGFPKIEKNPLYKTVRQDERRNAERNRSYRDRATAFLADDIPKR